MPGDCGTDAAVSVLPVRCPSEPLHRSAPEIPRCETWKSRLHRRSRHDRYGRPAESPHRREWGAHGAHFQRERLQSQRRFPCALQHSRCDTARPPDRLPDQSGCRRKNNLRRQWSRFSAEAACPAGSLPPGSRGLLRRSRALLRKHSCGRTGGHGLRRRCRLQHRRRAQFPWGGCGFRF